ncbi:MAG TPA: ATP-dependent DNA helicase [Candidatus Saccharimonadales bacterium]|nr:ATP-dependent DNA helicase [Candidatus Saccharimonadales bacterium]
MNLDFDKEYARLNEAQKQAVDTIDGPVLVIAGPGTGKTQLLSVRVANILKQTDTDPAAILCLTFTNFAATNMRERLNQLVGPTARNVYVRTFHSFAAELMQLYPDYFWNGAKLMVVPDAVQLEIIQGILARLPLNNPLALKFADNFTAVSDIQTGLKLAKEAGLTPDKLRAMVSFNEAYIDIIEVQLAEILEDKLSIKKLNHIQSAVNQLPDMEIDASIAPLRSLGSVIKDSLDAAVEADTTAGRTTQTGKWKKKWVQTVDGKKGMYEERKRNSWWKELCDVYEHYRTELHNRGYYDYSDMVVEVISVLEQNSQLLSSVQERFNYVLIDEFQDANKAQLRLAQLVASHHSNEGRPNLMAVGDDDQTIFAFNGAELNNMLSFESSYPDTKTIVLTENYRSTQAILDAADAIISQADDRLVKRISKLKKDLRAATNPNKGEIAHYKYPTREHQLQEIAQRIKASWNSNPPASLAVLARSHDSLRKISAYLIEAGVPIKYEQQNNILDLELIQQIVLLAESITAIAAGDAQEVDFTLSKLLTHPAWRIEPESLWRLAVANYGKQGGWLDSLLTNDGENLKNIGDWLLWLSREAVKEPLPVLIEYLIGLRTGEYLTSPLREYFLTLKGINSRYLETLSGLNVLRELVSDFSATRSVMPELNDFVRFMKLNQELGRQIVDESWFVSSDRAVQLMTIHKSKGLEFDIVYLLDANEKDWQPRHIGRKPPANLPLQPYGEVNDDYVRLAYVAATRSRSTLVVSSFMNDTSGQKLLSSPLFDPLEAHVYDTKDETPGQRITVLEAGLSWPRLTSTDEKALLGPRLSSFSLSPTALLQYLDVTTGGPRAFLENHLLRLPSSYTPHMAYGVAMHSALQTAQQLINTQQFDLDKIKTAFASSLEAQQQPSSSLHRYLPQGEKILDRLFNDFGFSLPEGGQAELALSLELDAGIMLKGVIDNGYVEDGGLLISDYKTGKPLGSFATKAQNKAVKAWRHYNQLLFYTLLAQGSDRFPRTTNIRTRMIYVEAEQLKELTLDLTPQPDELQKLKALIAAVWKKIQAYDFPDTSMFSDDIGGIHDFEDLLLK